MTDTTSSGNSPITDSTSPNRPVAIVTGSSSGIGQAVAVDLAAHGWDLVIHGLTDDSTADAMALVQKSGAAQTAVIGDTRNHGTIDALVDAATSHFGRIDGIVSNAGTGLTKNFLETDETDWESILTMHVTSAARLLRLAAPHLAESQGSAVTVSSVAATRALPGRTAYGTAKAGLEALTRGLAIEWADKGVRVNAVSPGTIATPLVEKNFRTGRLDGAGVLSRTPLNRLGEPSEVAGAVRFLLGSDSTYITGQTLAVDGGWSIWGGWR
jgi:NAD(P)-dependent dehydrogenase (short-subunit alcohol dehydrogenase family)